VGLLERRRRVLWLSNAILCLVYNPNCLIYRREPYFLVVDASEQSRWVDGSLAATGRRRSEIQRSNDDRERQALGTGRAGDRRDIAKEMDD
jgi:hypothetical protein